MKMVVVVFLLIALVAGAMMAWAISRDQAGMRESFENGRQQGASVFTENGE